MKKILAVSIILLFLGVAVAPSINFTVVKASDDNDLVEVTTQACGINGFGNTTVKLTREQYQNLEQYLVEFRARLNQTTTREEAVPIFKEAVVELDKYGLLPRGMSVEKAFKLMTNINNQRLKILDSLDLDPDANYFCLVSGITSETSCFGPFAILAGPVSFYTQVFSLYLGGVWDYFYYHNQTILAQLVNLLSISMAPLFWWSVTRGIITSFLPFGFLSTLTFGYTGYENSEASSGWVNSVGLNGNKKYEGSELWGTASKIIIPVLTFLEHYPGIIGFTGLKLGLKTNFFLGSALKVKLGTEFPG